MISAAHTITDNSRQRWTISPILTNEGKHTVVCKSLNTPSPMTCFLDVLVHNFLLEQIKGKMKNVQNLLHRPLFLPSNVLNSTNKHYLCINVCVLCRGCVLLFISLKTSHLTRGAQIFAHDCTVQDCEDNGKWVELKTCPLASIISKRLFCSFLSTGK